MNQLYHLHIEKAAHATELTLWIINIQVLGTQLRPKAYSSIVGFPQFKPRNILSVLSKNSSISWHFISLFV